MKKETNIFLINNWILFELSQLEKDYQRYLIVGNWELSYITNRLISFVNNIFSKQYLELLKTIEVWDKITEEVFLFVFQQILLLLHPFVPFITSFLFEQITEEQINNNFFQFFTLKKKTIFDKLIVFFW